MLNISQPAKTPKTATKLKLSTPKASKAPAEEKKKAPAPKTKKAAPKKGKAAASDEEPVEAKEAEKQIDPEELKKKKEKEGMFCSSFPEDQPRNIQKMLILLSSPVFAPQASEGIYFSR